MTTCGSVALLTPELVIELDQLQADWPGDEVWGCDFDAEHPGKHPDERHGDASDNYVPYRVELTDAGREHPITAGVPDFELTTEQYWVLADDYIDVLATTTQAVRSWDPWTRPVTSRCTSARSDSPARPPAR